MPGSSMVLYKQCDGQLKNIAEPVFPCDSGSRIGTSFCTHDQYLLIVFRALFVIYYIS